MQHIVSRVDTPPLNPPQGAPPQVCGGAPPTGVIQAEFFEYRMSITMFNYIEKVACYQSLYHSFIYK